MALEARRDHASPRPPYQHSLTTGAQYTAPSLSVSRSRAVSGTVIKRATTGARSPDLNSKVALHLLQRRATFNGQLHPPQEKGE
jgi:hypothetical protein